MLCGSGTYFASLGVKLGNETQPCSHVSQLPPFSYIVCLFVDTHAQKHLGFSKLCYEGSQVFVEKIGDRQIRSVRVFQSFQLGT